MESVTESKQTTPGSLAYTLSGLSLLFAILCAVWTYIAWLSNSSILDFARLHLFLTHHGDVLTSLGAFSSGLATILLAHELGHALMAQNEFDGPPLWLPAPGLILPSLGGVQTTQTPLALKHPGWHALLGPLLGVVASLCCLLIGQLILLDTPYILKIDFSSQALLIQLLGQFGLGLELNALQVAGWMGLLLSGLQLLPIGATDGGQVLRTLLPGLHLPVSLMTLVALTLFAFSLPMKVAMTWWVWAGFSVLHLFGNPVKASRTQRGLGSQLVLVSLWLPLVIGITQVTHLAIPEPVIPEADVSRKIEL